MDFTLERASGRRKVPVLGDEAMGITVAESERIPEHLETTDTPVEPPAPGAATRSA